MTPRGTSTYKTVRPLALSGQAVFSCGYSSKSMMEIREQVNTAICFAKIIEDEAIYNFKAN